MNQTPKDKAKELFDKFMKPIDGLHKYPMCFDTAKQCAMIAVDEVIEALHEHHWQNRLIIDYWEEVKNEIENYG
jgi:hypothetical protein